LIGVEAMPSLNTVAVDFGASGGRTTLGRFDGNVLKVRTVHQFPNGPVEIDGHLHWDFSRLLSELKIGLTKSAQSTDERLASLAVDTWGVDYGLLDSAGELLEDPYHYRDLRTEGMYRRAFERIPAGKIFAKTGLAFLPFNTIYQLLAAKVHSPGVLDRTETMLMLPDLFAYFLTGKRLTEYTDGTTTQLVDVKRRDWSWEIIRALGIPEGIFTPIEYPPTVRGELTDSIKEETGLSSLKVIAVAGHDTASAVVGTPLADEGSVYLSCGTWSLLGVEIDAPIINDAVREWNFTNEGGTDGRYRLLRNIAGLWILQECKREWDLEGRTADYSELIGLGRRSEGFRSFVDPDADLFASPGEMPDKIAGFCRRTGQDVPETQGQIVRCALESLALKYRWAIDKLREIVDRPITCLHVVGGGSRNELLNEFTASALNLTVFAGPAEATTIGNIMIQLRGLGEVKSLDEARRIVRGSFPMRTYRPHETDSWDEAYERYRRMMRRWSEVSRDSRSVEDARY